MWRLAEWLAVKTTGRLALGALVLFVLFVALVLPRQAGEAEQASGSSASPDTSLVYTAEQLYAWAEAYGAAGRAAYVRARLTFDVVWPLVYTLFLTTALSWLMARAFAAGSRWRLTAVVPLLGMVFDFLENGATSLVMVRYPAETPVVAQMAGVLTLVKWLLVGGSFGLLLVGIVAAIRRRGQGR
ncbi:MAG: hypothetical protein RRC07_07135 [Anaerolineae bacterium]|nr:hypothetical protein [Anaerolineae bacterium]